MIARYGYRKTTFNDIAQEANLSKGTIRSYFDDKEDIYNQAVTHAGEKWINWLKENDSFGNL